MKIICKVVLSVILFFSHIHTYAQNKQKPHSAGQSAPITDDKKALEGIIVEKFYVADSSDYHDSVNGILDEGSVTYRIYVDLKPDYFLQVVYGSPKHPLTIKTTTRFYNNRLGGYIGYNLNYKYLNEGNFLLDTYFTLNSASNIYAGVPLEDDKDGSVLKRKAFSKADGFTNGNLPEIRPYNIDMNFFKNDQNPAVFTTPNGAWAGFSGIKPGAKGPTADNKILIAQLTTNGKISFELNIQVGTPSGGTVKFVAKNPEDDEVKSDSLIYNQ